MKIFRADLHIHTVLSPCGDLDMSPANIVSAAARRGINIIGITDHNTTRHCRLTSRLASGKGIFVMQGAEITTKEEVHCLAFFENDKTLETFQEYLGDSLPVIDNIPAIFGHQVQVDENEVIIYEEKKLLINAISKSLEEVEQFVHSLNGLFIPAHIDRSKNSIYSQLGFLPDSLNADALEVSRLSDTYKVVKHHPELECFPLIKCSDAHFTEDIGIATTEFLMEEASFNEICQALKGINGRKIITG